MRVRLPFYVGALAFLTLGFLYVPMAAVAVFSVNKSRYGLLWKGFTLQWYGQLLKNEFIIGAARNTRFWRWSPP